MQMAFLGTGNAWSKAPDNYNTNVIVRAGEEASRWLIDCGTTAPQAIKDRGLTLNDFSGALITHLHGDHVFGLEEMGFYNYFMHQRRTKLWLPAQLRASRGGVVGEDLWENCLRGTMGALYSDGPERHEVTLEDYFDVTYLSPGEAVDIEGVTAEIFAVDHVPHKPCFGVLLGGEGRERVGYTADCVYRRALVDWLLARGCETIFHDVYFGPVYPGRVHTAYEELLELPLDVRQRLVLMHYNDKLAPDQIQGALDAGFRFADRHQTYTF